jgi:hypothetical protein
LGAIRHLSRLCEALSLHAASIEGLPADSRIASPRRQRWPARMGPQCFGAGIHSEASIAISPASTGNDSGNRLPAGAGNDSGIAGWILQRDHGITSRQRHPERYPRPSTSIARHRSLSPTSTGNDSKIVSRPFIHSKIASRRRHRYRYCRPAPASIAGLPAGVGIHSWIPPGRRHR